MAEFKKLLLLFTPYLCLSLQTEAQDPFLAAKPCWVSDRQVEKNLTVALHAVVPANHPNKAVFNITAVSSYKCYLNGLFIGYGPSTSAHGFHRFDAYDLTSKLKNGTNILTVEVAGYNVDNYHIPNQPSFVQAELRIDGKVVAATMTGNKKEAFAFYLPQQRQQDVPKLSFQRPYMEAYVLVKDPHMWRNSTHPPFTRQEVEETDRKKILPRGVAYPDYSLLTAKRMGEQPYFAFEHNATGFIKTTIVVGSPSKLKLYWDEILEEGVIKKGRLGYNTYVTYQLQPGTYELETFEPYTLQYLGLELEYGDAVLESVSLRQYVNGDIHDARFETSDSSLNKIFRAAVETHRQSALDVFMDCPSRERAGWLCDSYFSARVADDLSGNNRIEKNFLENYLLPEKFNNIPDGMLPMCYPSDHTNGNFIPNWAMWFVIQLEEYLHRSGDRKLVDALGPRVMKLIHYFEPYRNEFGLLERLDKWVFVEWSKANDYVQDVNYPTNMLYARMLEAAGRLYHRPSLLSNAEMIRKVIRKQSYKNGFFCDHAIRKNGVLEVQQQHQTEACQYYAFYFGAATPKTYPELWQKLVKDFGVTRNTTTTWPDIAIANAFVGNYLRLELLSQAGLIQQILRESKDQFLYMYDRTGTLWENTYPGTSCCHGFASHIAHLFYRDIAGFKTVDRVHKKITIQINDINLQYCQATLPAQNGPIKISWEKKGDKIFYDLKVPKGYGSTVTGPPGMKLISKSTVPTG